MREQVYPRFRQFIEYLFRAELLVLQMHQLRTFLPFHYHILFANDKLEKEAFGLDVEDRSVVVDATEAPIHIWEVQAAGLHQGEGGEA